MISRNDLTHLVLLITLLGALTCQISEAGSSRKSKCPVERDLEMDVCASRLGFLGDHSFRVPKNVTGMSVVCAQLKESIGCIQNYARDCLQGFTRQVLTSLLKRGKQQYSSICTDNKSKQQLINKMSCLEGDKIEPLHSCMDASVVRFEYIASNAVQPDSRLPGICCSYQIFNREIDSTLERVCGKPKTKANSANEFVHKVVGGTAGEFFQLICEGHRSLEDCKASKKTGNLIGKLEELTRLAQNGRIKPKNKSLVPVLLEILDSSAQ